MVAAHGSTRGSQKVYPFFSPASSRLLVLKPKSSSTTRGTNAVQNSSRYSYLPSPSSSNLLRFCPHSDSTSHPLNLLASSHSISLLFLHRNLSFSFVSPILYGNGPQALSVGFLFRNGLGLLNALLRLKRLSYQDIPNNASHAAHLLSLQVSERDCFKRPCSHGSLHSSRTTISFVS